MNGKREGEVGGDPVRSTDPEMILWGPQILRCQVLNIPAPIRRVKRPLYEILAFNARLLLVFAVKRSNIACFWRLRPG